MPVLIIDDDTQPIPRKRKPQRKPQDDGPIPWSFPCKEHMAWMSAPALAVHEVEEVDPEDIEPLPGFLRHNKPPAGACRCPN